MQKITSLSLHVRVGLLTLFLLGCFLAGCAPKEPPLPTELTFHYWADYFPPEVLEAFTQEYGIKINYRPFETTDSAVMAIRSGEVVDLSILTPNQVPMLISGGHLARIDQRPQLLNFKNISANFRDLNYDPGNRYTVPFTWGSQGILVNRDLTNIEITRWADLWKPELAGHVGYWETTDMLAVGLKALGYSINSEDALELNAARQKLALLRQNAFLIPIDEPSLVPFLKSGKIWVGVGWAYDALNTQAEGLNTEYILPEDGTILWSEVYVIPASTRSLPAAMRLLDFLLRPEISAQIMEWKLTASPNDPAMELLSPQLRDNPLVFPAAKFLEKSEIYLPLSPEGQKRFDEAWQNYLTDSAQMAP